MTISLKLYLKEKAASSKLKNKTHLQKLLRVPQKAISIQEKAASSKLKNRTYLQNLLSVPQKATSIP